MLKEVFLGRRKIIISDKSLALQMEWEALRTISVWVKIKQFFSLLSFFKRQLTVKESSPKKTLKKILSTFVFNLSRSKVFNSNSKKEGNRNILLT